MLKNLSALRTTLIKSCDLHGSERSIIDHPPSAGWIAEARRLFLRHNEQAADILSCADTGDEKPAVHENDSRANPVDFRLQLRNAERSAIIRELGTGVILATQEYALVHGTAVALEDYELAGLQLAQLEETTPLVMRMSRVLTEAAVADLGETYHVPHAEAAMRVATRDIEKAWLPHG